MSRPDKRHRQPGHDAPRAGHPPADRDPAPATPARDLPAPPGESAAPAAEASPGQAATGAGEADWDAWEREAAVQARATGRPDALAEDAAEADEHEGPLPDESHLTRVRIDKWLWAARFFRTRSLAKEAIEGGKVHCDGQRVKVSKDIKVGMTLEVRQGFDEKTVVVKALSEVRGPAPVAQKLYEETAESLAAREQRQADRRSHNLAHPDHRPSKKDRRQIHRFKDSWGE